MMSRTRELGARWLEKLLPELQRYPAGTIVSVNIGTGEYITGADLDEVERRSNEHYGVPPAQQGRHWMVRLEEGGDGLKRPAAWLH